MKKSAVVVLCVLLVVITFFLTFIAQYIADDDPQRIANLIQQNDELFGQIDALTGQIAQKDEAIVRVAEEKRKIEHSLYRRENFIRELNLPETTIFAVVARMAIIGEGKEAVDDILGIFSFEGEGTRDLYSQFPLYKEGDWKVSFVKQGK